MVESVILWDPWIQLLMLRSVVWYHLEDTSPAPLPPWSMLDHTGRVQPEACSARQVQTTVLPGPA